MVVDYIDINTKTPIKEFSKKLAEIRLGYDKDHKPFDEPCARLEFRDIVDKAEKESERRHGFVNMDDVNVNLDKFDFAKYGKSDRFVLIEDQADKENILVNSIKTSVVIGHTLSYRCRTRGHGISVFIPIADYEAMSEKNKEINAVLKINK